MFKNIKVTVVKAEGPCSRMKEGMEFRIRNARLEIPEGQSVCIFALGSLLPVISGAIIKNVEGQGVLNILQEWQCPDPLSEVIFRIEEEKSTATS
ncbi:MAG: TIGR04076 family protein [candidate division WOR-3 bacterium]|nr:MAG: TIGR04076 family protein [candidate division WOR-3 bacterium]